MEPADGGDVLTPQEVYVERKLIVLPKWQGWAKATRQKLDEAMAQDAESKQAA